MRQDAVFANDNFYHIFNRGVARLPTFSQIKDYEHLLLNCQYYRFEKPPMKLSKFRRLTLKHRQEIINSITLHQKQIVSVACFTFMPNHFHLLLRQNIDKGISWYLSQITNSYTKYFNTKYKRVGPLFQGPFKAVHIKTEAQLVHVSRYIHLNSLISEVVPTIEMLFDYPWSSFNDYLIGKSNWIHLDPVLSHFKSPHEYRQFVVDQINYAKELHHIRKIILD